MDSLSQIVLGAAVGEAVLGRKIGNRAMVVGAIAGTIPDLDIIANPFLDPMQALDFHRGITHSFAFAVVAPFLFAGIAHWFFKNDHQNNKWYRGILTLLATVSIAAVTALVAYSAFLAKAVISGAVVIGVGILLSLPMLRWWRRKASPSRDTGYAAWYWLFFWCFLTHLALDVFTTYGTQVFMPFHNYRLAFSSISVVDPLYTLPFLGCILVAATMWRGAKERAYITWAGIIISSLYLLFGVYAKTVMNEVFTDSLKAKGVEYERYVTTPSLFNAVLWSGTAETDSLYYIGTYSLFDPQRKIKRFSVVPKNHQLLEGHNGDPHIATLKRFTNGYYTISQDSTKTEFIDLRWGMLDRVAKVDSKYRYPLKFELVKNQSGRMVAEEEKPLSLLERVEKFLEEIKHLASHRVLMSYWERIKGRWQ